MDKKNLFRLALLLVAAGALASFAAGAVLLTAVCGAWL